MAQKAKAVANYFIDRAEREGRTLTPLQLIKLVYIAHGWHLAVSGGRPLVDERIHAWKYGPVVEDLYHEFKHFGGSPITDRASEVWPIDDSFYLEYPELEDADPDYELAVGVLDRVWKAYSGLSGGQLIELTHASGTPWDKVYNTGQRNAVIPDDEIQGHFVEKAKKNPAKRK